jgi:DNA-binding NtrC family response regulator
MSAVPVLAPTNLRCAVVASADPDFRDRVAQALASCELSAIEASGGADALAKLESHAPAILVIDRGLPDLEPTDLTAFVREHYPAMHVCILDSANPEGLCAVALPAQPSSSEISHILQRLSVGPGPQTARGALVDFPGPLSPAEQSQEPLPGMAGRSYPMLQVARLVKLVAPRTTAVVIQGETGTGKELVARAIHELSPRRNKAFVTVNCAAIPDTLLEAELFGYTRGAFTGAMQSRIGRAQAAQGGTLFLDEIGEMSLSLQAKVLRFLQEGEVQRLGSNEVIRTDVRIVAATNAELSSLVSEKRFRADLYFRLSAFPVPLPPLRVRRGDVELLAKRFLAEYCQASGVPGKSFAPETLQLLSRQTWPGNVRELRHTVERAFILAEEQRSILPAHLAPLLAAS